jgi:hypothetical protein
VNPTAMQQRSRNNNDYIVLKTLLAGISADIEHLQSLYFSGLRTAAKDMVQHIPQAFLNVSGNNKNNSGLQATTEGQSLQTWKK